MKPGYDRPLYLLPFDHRHSCITGMFHFEPPLTREQNDAVADSKRLVYEGFEQAAGADAGVSRDAAGILVDEEFGTPILRDARQRGYVTAVSTEKSGADEFEFEYGPDFADHIEAVDPIFAKALVRYNPQGQRALNQRQEERLKQLSDACRRSQRRLMFELLVPATAAQLKRVDGDRDAYDHQLRPALVIEAMRALQDAGVEPDVWKIESLARCADCERVVETARQDGRDAVGCIVLGRGADEARVHGWLATAASVTGFAVGRTSFWDAVAGYRAHTLTRAQAAAKIAGRFREWVDVFEQARRIHTVAAAP